MPCAKLIFQATYVLKDAVPVRQPIQLSSWILSKAKKTQYGIGFSLHSNSSYVVEPSLVSVVNNFSFESVIIFSFLGRHCQERKMTYNYCENV